MEIKRVPIPNHNLETDEGREQWKKWCDKYDVIPTYNPYRGIIKSSMQKLKTADYLICIDGVPTTIAWKEDGDDEVVDGI